MQAIGFKPMRGSFKMKFPQSEGVLTAKFEFSDNPGKTDFTVSGESFHILYKSHFTITDDGSSMACVVELVNRLYKE